jgi:hypothetical protein
MLSVAPSRSITGDAISFRFVALMRTAEASVELISASHFIERP